MKSPKLLASLALGALIVAMVVGLALVTLNQAPASAATLAQATTPATATPSATTGTTTGKAKSTTNADKTQLRDEFLKNFAANLGIDQTKLNSAYTSAINQTVDQAVKDGKLTADQATKIKDAAKTGFQGEFDFPGKDGLGRGGFGKGRAGGDFMNGTLDAAAKSLNITTAELKTDLQAGQSIADVAKAKNVDIQTVKTAVLAAIKADLDTAVKNSKLTQAQADTMYTKISGNIDQIISSTHAGHKRGK